MSKLYAQFDADGVCTCVGTPNITGIEADYDCLGKKYVDGIWVDPESEEEKTEELELDENSIRGGVAVSV